MIFHVQPTDSKFHSHEGAESEIFSWMGRYIKRKKNLGVFPLYLQVVLLPAFLWVNLKKWMWRSNFRVYLESITPFLYLSRAVGVLIAQAVGPRHA